MVKSKKNRFIVISCLLVLFLSAGGVVLFLIQKQKTQTTENSTVSSSTKNNNPKDQPNDNPKSDNPKKILAQQIKADLQKDLDKVQKGDTIHNLTYVNRPWGECDIPDGEEGYIVLISPDAPENKGKRELIAPSELEKKDYDEIVSLIKQVNTTREKVSEQKKKEAEAKIDQKLSSNPKMFFYEGKNDWEDYTARHFFLGWGDGKRYKLVLPENHPAIASLPNNQKDNPHLKQTGFYLIEGIENMSFQPEKVGLYPWKEVNLSDKITITLLNS